MISPILSNVFLHYVLDLWIAQWRRQSGRGRIVVVRYCDDFVIGFEHKNEAIACLNALRERFAKFGLKLNDRKTRLIEFGRYAAENRKRRGEGRPETFDFLGFTHQCSKTRAHGRFTIRRVSISKRFRAKLAEIKVKLRQRWNAPLEELGRWLSSVVRGCGADRDYGKEFSAARKSRCQVRGQNLKPAKPDHWVQRQSQRPNEDPNPITRYRPNPITGSDAKEMT